MPVKLSIGDFSRMTHLSVKALRYYHDLGLLRPADVNAETGYRSYDSGQVATAGVIRRFRDLGMPVEQIKAVLDTGNLGDRNALRRRPFAADGNTARANAGKRLVAAPAARSRTGTHPRRVPLGAARLRRSDHADDRPGRSQPVVAGSVRRDRTRAAPCRRSSRRPARGLYATELLTHEVGEITVFVPVAQSIEAAGRVGMKEIGAGEFAVAVHEGPLRDADRTYGPLGTHVAERSIGVEGPIREHYLVTDDDTADETQLRTEICWPVFRIEPRS
jgi:DNA-binding transcriptional MerR regulator